MDELEEGERTKVNRALQRLTDIELCSREKQPSGSRGYQYSYSPKSLSVLQDELKDLINEWYDSINLRIDSLQSEFENKYNS
jgi:predicted transcriptional regulator